MVLSETPVSENASQRSPITYTPNTTLLVVDDEAIVCEALVAFLNTVQGFEVVGQATDGQQAKALALAHQPIVCPTRSGYGSGVGGDGRWTGNTVIRVKGGGIGGTMFLIWVYPSTGA